MKELKNCAGKEVANAQAQANNYKSLKEHETPDEQVLQKAIENWWSALANTGVEDNKYLDAMDNSLKAYANMAYQGTQKVGCGVQVCKPQGRTEIQCGYVMDPPIMDEDPIYEIGKACSKCAKLATPMKCSSLLGLCVP
ncbi:hypothetical protein Y032_1162g3713 [Ancylostoma ceylanicum]|uniref:SCP domain-containing protein n=1 Tax=Ancylostoma ceylanicum TaxID=53326 RepID=A0A016W5I7_9BILA|nr:hypothetical protein Y032_1162g3713 [Ancylostoma ceylanicum]